MSIALLLLVGTLGTTWNLVVVRYYERMIQIARNQLGQVPQDEWGSYPWWTLGLGTLGFLSLLVLIVFVTLKLFREMRANQAQSEFLAHISHELKSPLATLELSSNLLEAEYPKSSKTDQLWLSHRSELQRLKVEIERLLTASRWENVQDRPVVEPVDLRSWVLQRSEQWRAILGGNGELKVQVPEEEIWILGSFNYLDLIANNLVDNARKFSGNRQAKLEVVLSVDTDSKNRPRWKLKFIDGGLGFDPKQAKKIFRRFYRAPNYSHRSAGSGLGLYLVRSAARTLKLKIRAFSNGNGHGATFQLEGPLQQ